MTELQDRGNVALGSQQTRFSFLLQTLAFRLTTSFLFSGPLGSDFRFRKSAHSSLSMQIKPGWEHGASWPPVLIATNGTEVVVVVVVVLVVVVVVVVVS